MELLTTGRWLSGTEAAAWGLVLRAVPADELDRELEELVAPIRTKSRPGLGWIKSVTRRGDGLSLDDGVSLETMAFVQYVATSDHPLKEYRLSRKKDSLNSRLCLLRNSTVTASNAMMEWLPCHGSGWGGRDQGAIPSPPQGGLLNLRSSHEDHRHPRRYTHHFLRVFPPRTEEGISGVFGAIQRLQRFSPDFISVTYGAGGSTRAFTERITVEAKELGDMEVMAHLTCVGQTKEEVHGVLERLDASGIDNVIALRGDPPRGESNFVPVEGGFEHATELIDHIQRNFEFGLAAACYPEGHTESVDLDSDLEYTKQKVNKGADFLITQLFYDNADFFGFMDRAAKAGINVPIIPGMLPILNTAQIRRFTALCGAKIPAGLDQKLDRYADDDDAVRELGVEHATRQAEELWASGVPGFTSTCSTGATRSRNPGQSGPAQA